MRGISIILLLYAIVLVNLSSMGGVVIAVDRSDDNLSKAKSITKVSDRLENVLGAVIVDIPNAKVLWKDTNQVIYEVVYYEMTNQTDIGLLKKDFALGGLTNTIIIETNDPFSYVTNTFTPFGLDD